MKIKAAKSTVAEIDMTPMIDVTFQLIAFFMVITNFENTKADERVKLPRNELAKPAEVKKEQSLVLNVGFIRDKEGKKLSDPLVFYTGEDVPVGDMTDKLQREARIFQDLGKKVDDVTVEIRADSEVPTGMVQELIRMSQEAKFVKFALKATSEE